MGDELTEFIRDLLKNHIEYVEGRIEVKPNITPKHGACCTCQHCGYHYDECNCVARMWTDVIEQATNKILTRIQQESLQAKIEQNDNFRNIVLDVISKQNSYYDWELRGCPVGEKKNIDQIKKDLRD